LFAGAAWWYLYRLRWNCFHQRTFMLVMPCAAELGGDGGRTVCYAAESPQAFFVTAAKSVWIAAA